MPPVDTQGVPGAMQVTVGGGSGAFTGRIVMQYLETDYNPGQGQGAGSMRIHQLIEDPPGTFRWVLLPGPQTVNPNTNTVSGNFGQVNFRNTPESIQKKVNEVFKMHGKSLLGAAGGVAAYPLAEAGLDVVGLEAGTWLDRRDFAPDEIRNNYRDWPMLIDKCEQERPTARATAATTARRVGSHPMMNAVGGTTLHYWAQSWRLNPWDTRSHRHPALPRVQGYDGHTGELSRSLWRGS